MNEPMVLKMATDEDVKSGWTLDYRMLETIKGMVEHYEYGPSMEGVELVLLAFHNMPIPKELLEDNDYSE